MSKEYQCIANGGCIHNNHGWCKVKKKNGLKGTTDCDSAEYESMKTVATKDEDSIFETESESAFRVMGKREMLFHLQKECLAKGDALTLEDISKFSKILDVEESLRNPEQYQKSEIDSDIREASKKIADATLESKDKEEAPF